MLGKGVFPDDLKHDDVVAASKKKDKRDKTNYRPMIVLPNFSKVYEKLTSNPSQCGFRKWCSIQYSFLVMLENFKESINKDNEFGALLTNILKAFQFTDPVSLVSF